MGSCGKGKFLCIADILDAKGFGNLVNHNNVLGAEFLAYNRIDIDCGIVFPNRNLQHKAVD